MSNNFNYVQQPLFAPASYQQQQQQQQQQAQFHPTNQVSPTVLFSFLEMMDGNRILHPSAL